MLMFNILYHYTGFSYTMNEIKSGNIISTQQCDCHGYYIQGNITHTYGNRKHHHESYGH